MNFSMVTIIMSSVGYQKGLQVYVVFMNKYLECIWLELYMWSMSDASKRVEPRNTTPTR